MTFRRILNLIVLILLISSCSKLAPIVFPTDPGNFNSGWEFLKDPTDSISPEMFQKNEPQKTVWQKVSLPHTANVEPVDSPEKQWQGIARYRKFFTVPKQFEGKSVTLLSLIHI